MVPGWYGRGAPPVCTPNLNVNPACISTLPLAVIALQGCWPSCPVWADLQMPPGASGPGVSPEATSPWTKLPSQWLQEQRGSDLCTADINGSRKEVETFHFH